MMNMSPVAPPAPLPPMGFGDAAASPAPAQTDAQQQASRDSAAESAWRARITKCKRVRKELVQAWATNVDYRRGKPFTQDSDVDRINVNLDWSLTNGKHAQLYSQTPQVFLTPKQPQFKAAMYPFAKQLNDTLQQARVGAAMDEAVFDTINASGIGVALVGYRTTTVPKQVPAIDTKGLDAGQLAAIQQAGTLPMQEVPQVVSRMYYIKRVSPSDFLWPLEFQGSDFDDADWLGRSGTLPWADAQREFNLSEADKSRILSARTKDATLREGIDGATNHSEDPEPVVEFDELYYWAYRFNPAETSFTKIRRVVFVSGMNEPVIHEDWKGQVQTPDGKYIGACKFPIRVLTLTYVSDDAIPPSDSAIGRPQVNELIESRTQMMLQRKRSQPWRWYDPNRVDPLVGESILRGEYETVMPIPGGDKAIGEVARAQYPPEDFAFDRTIKQDLSEQWAVGSNQAGSMTTGRRSAAEAEITQQNFETRVGYERARVAAFFTGIAEVTAGLLALFGDFPMLSDAEQQAMGNWDRRSIANEYVYWIRPDSTVMLDANQRIERLMKILNMVGKSGFVNPKPIIEELVELHGLDASQLIIDPQPPKPSEPNISYRFSGAADLSNPIALAIMGRAGQLPSPDELNAAKILLNATSTPPEGPHAANPPSGVPNRLGAGLPSGPQGRPMPPVGDAHPNWGLMPSIVKRESDL